MSDAMVSQDFDISASVGAAKIQSAWQYGRRIERIHFGHRLVLGAHSAIVRINEFIKPDYAVREKLLFEIIKANKIVLNPVHRLETASFTESLMTL